jgi:hypothetical protein
MTGYETIRRSTGPYATVFPGQPALRRELADPARRMSVHQVGARLREIEREVAMDPATAIERDSSGCATLVAAGCRHRAGRFTLAAVGEIEARLSERRAQEGVPGRLSFSVLLGVSELTDIGTLQATAAPGTLFQVASQFNCLESPGPHVTPIATYVTDSTQGPRASVSAFPGTFLRHYAAPGLDGGVFVQTARRQINLLEDAVSPDVATVDCGYLRAQGVRDESALREALENNFGRIRVGVHDDVEVVFGTNWGGPVPAGAPTIAQVFTSTMALGGYSFGGSGRYDACCSLLLRAAYLGTILSALDLGKAAVVLTLIGGGAFGNKTPRIWDAILWAVERAGRSAPADLLVLLNGRTLTDDIPRGEILEAVRARDGALVDLADMATRDQ